MREINCFNIKEGYYSIDEYGNVYSKTYKRYLSPKLMKDGYLDLSLVCNDGIRRHFRIHRLVAEIYIGNPEDFPIVLHLDNDKTNNYYGNLKWGTISENTQQAYDDGCCSCNKPCYLYNKETMELIEEFISVSELARYFNYKPGMSTKLGMMCEGIYPMPTKGRLADYFISYDRLNN